MLALQRFRKVKVRLDPIMQLQQVELAPHSMISQKGEPLLVPSPPQAMTVSAKDRVQKHRDKLREQHCRRLEVWIESGVVEDLRTIARYRGVPLRQMVREAFQGAVTSYAGVLEVLKRNTAGTWRSGSASA